MVSKKEIIVILVFSVIFVFFNRNNFFFWDNISQLAVPANYYFNNNFNTLYIPSEIATGHQPFFAMYLAIGWKFLGRSIVISHWLMLPFIFGVAYELLRFIRFFVKNYSKSLIIFLICLIDSVLVSQLSLITFEIPHIFFFLATLNSLLRKEKLWTSIFCLCLCLVSLRSTMSAIGIVLFYVLYEILILKKFRLNSYQVFVPGFLAFILFLITFYLYQGWIIHNVVSKNWENAAKYSDLKGMLKNVFIFFWRFFDFGRLIFLLFSTIIISQIFKNRVFDQNFLLIILICLTQFIIFFITIIPYENSITHRFLLPISLVFSIAISYWFLNFKSEKFYIVYIIVYLLSGYLWIYPEKIAKAWDSMPAHRSYYELRNDAVKYLEQNNISVEKTGSFFPNLNTFENTTLQISHNKFKKINLKHDNYILFSNVYNCSDEIIDSLKTENFKPVFKVTENFVEVTIYKHLKK